jgi:hypothetical protein
MLPEHILIANTTLKFQQGYVCFLPRLCGALRIFVNAEFRGTGKEAVMFYCLVRDQGKP